MQLSPSVSRFDTGIIFADDLTGALEMGVLARRAGYRCTVYISDYQAPLEFSDSEVLVVDCENRELPPDAAVAALQRVTGSFPEAAGLAILKKTDSLLRGNIAVELAALRRAYPQRRIVYVPAYPLLGRYVRSGKLSVQSPTGLATAGDVLGLLAPAIPPSAVASINTAGQLQEALWDDTKIPADSSTVLVCDGESQEVVDAMGRMLREHLGRVIVAGPAGVFRSIFPEVPQPIRTPPYLPSGVGFLGSEHPVSAAQWEALAGWPHAVRRDIDGPVFAPYETLWREAVQSDQWLMLRAKPTGGAAPSLHFSPLPDALLLSGGATAAACLRLLGCRQLEPVLELEPGIVLSEAPIGNRCVPVITKSGAFGDAQTLTRILAMLQEGALSS